jgi:hypothetical protein
VSDPSTLPTATHPCSHVRVEVAWSNAPDGAGAAALPYGRPILQHGSCRVCGAGLERQRRIDGWGPWFACNGSIIDADGVARGGITHG